METNDKLFTLKKYFLLWRSKRKRGTAFPIELKERAWNFLLKKKCIELLKLVPYQ